MNISTETREILRNYKAVINARRREMGQKPGNCRHRFKIWISSGRRPNSMVCSRR